MTDRLLALAATYAQLGLLAVGGVNSVVPEMHRQIVDVRGWMSAREFAALFALAQAAPGPNLLVVTLVGWRVAGFAGALIATGSVIGPTSLLTYVLSRAWHRAAAARWRVVVQAGLTPVTVGLVLAAASLLARAAVEGAGSVVVIILVTALSLRGGVHPLLLLAAGAGLGAAGLL